VSWLNQASEQTGFKIERSIDGIHFSQIAQITGTSYVNKSLVAGTDLHLPRSRDVGGNRLRVQHPGNGDGVIQHFVEPKGRLFKKYDGLNSPGRKAGDRTANGAAIRAIPAFRPGLLRDSPASYLRSEDARLAVAWSHRKLTADTSANCGSRAAGRSCRGGVQSCAPRAGGAAKRGWHGLPDEHSSRASRWVERPREQPRSSRRRSRGRRRCANRRGFLNLLARRCIRSHDEQRCIRRRREDAGVGRRRHGGAVDQHDIVLVGQIVEMIRERGVVQHFGRARRRGTARQQVRPSIAVR